jgi:hypothetical protein
MSIVEKRSARRAAQNERMFSATCICVEILVGAPAIYALMLEATAAPPQSKAPAGISFVGP